MTSWRVTYWKPSGPEHAEDGVVPTDDPKEATEVHFYVGHDEEVRVPIEALTGQVPLAVIRAAFRAGRRFQAAELRKALQPA